MDRVAFILGAGAHMPFGFPSGAELKTLICNEPTHFTPASKDRFQVARRHILDCGVSIDRLLSTNRDLDDIVRPLIARVLLSKENEAADRGMQDWLEYIWPMLIADVHSSTPHRFCFITFNYDRTLEYRIARAIDALQGVGSIEAAQLAAGMDIYHVYGSLGDIHSQSSDHVPYGASGLFSISGAKIRIIGEADVETCKREIHERLSGARLIYMLGCHFHDENMKLLSLECLPDIDRVFRTTCFGHTRAEMDRVERAYPMLRNGLTNATAIECLRNCGNFQGLRTSQ